MSLDPQRRAEMAELAARLEMPEFDLDLLNLAFTHSSYANEQDATENYGNERLEFLGDAIVGYAITELLYNDYPHLREGQLSKIKSVVVSKRILAECTIDLELGEHLLLGKGEEQTGGRTRISILGNLFECLIGAIHLSCGIDVATAFVREQLYDEIDKTVRGESIVDYKSLLQEHVQKQFGLLPVYKVVSSKGPDHDKDFVVEVSVRDERLGEGHGKSKKRAEKDAANNALIHLGVDTSVYR